MSRRISFGKYYAGTYCGEHLFSLRDWQRNLKHYGIIRRARWGFSIGPVIFWRKDSE